MTYAREDAIRLALTARARHEHGETRLRLVPELDLCQAQARIDLAAVNGQLCGWEIKTAGDTLARLPHQIEVYGRIFDRVWLVTAGRHLDRALPMVPQWWGVIQVSGDEKSHDLRELRRAKVNRSVDMGSLVRLLWKSEVIEELERLRMDSGLRRAPRSEAWARLAAASPRHISKTELKRRVRERLINRQGWRAD